MLKSWIAEVSLSICILSIIVTFSLLHRYELQAVEKMCLSICIGLVSMQMKYIKENGFHYLIFILQIMQELIYLFYCASMFAI